MYRIILNPISGNGNSLRKLGAIEDVLKRRNIRYDIRQTKSREDSLTAAQEACVASPEGIIVVGGDGTFFDIANGVTRSDIPVIFVSCGTGNDFVKASPLPADPIDALEFQLNSAIGHIDVGTMNEYRFLNVSGTGFDVDVLRKTEQYKVRYTGLKAYMHGLLDAFKSFKPMEAYISYDDGPEESVSFSIISIGNGQYFGGGMKPVPGAILNDGLFDVVTVAPVAKFSLLPLLVFFVKGLHVRIGLGKKRRCRKISIRCENMTINMDGELRNTDRAVFEILPRALAVRIPGFD